MNVFQSNSAPFLLALIVSALGWYVGQINSDIRSTKVATYRLEADPRAPTASVMVENVSRTESLKGIQLVLKCPHRPILARSRNNDGGLISPPPAYPIEASRILSTPGQEGATASLAPGGAIGLWATLADCNEPLEFFYRQQGEDRFLLLNANSLRGWMARNYVDALPILFLVMLTLFLAWLAVSLFYWWRKRHESAVADNVYHVRLLPGDPGELRTGTTEGQTNHVRRQGPRRTKGHPK